MAASNAPGRPSRGTVQRPTTVDTTGRRHPRAATPRRGRWPSLTAALAALLVASPSLAVASPTKVGLSAGAGYGEGTQARLQGQLDLGLTPAWAWRLAAGPAYAQGGAGVQFTTGLVYALDALRYVPRLALLVGAEVPSGAVRLQGGLELARTLGLHADVYLGAYATYNPGGQAGGLLAVGAGWEL